MIKKNTCFKSSGSCIDLILTNKIYYSRNTDALEIGLIDHHSAIYTMVKVSFKNPHQIDFSTEAIKNFT